MLSLEESFWLYDIFGCLLIGVFMALSVTFMWISMSKQGFKGKGE